MRWPGIEPGSTAWKAAMLTTIPPSPDGISQFVTYHTGSPCVCYPMENSDMLILLFFFLVSLLTICRCLRKKKNQFEWLCFVFSGKHSPLFPTRGCFTGRQGPNVLVLRNLSVNCVCVCLIVLTVTGSCWTCGACGTRGPSLTCGFSVKRPRCSTTPNRRVGGGGSPVMMIWALGPG